MPSDCSPRLLARLSINPSPETIFACVRLGHKYRADILYRPAIAYLTSHFSRDLEQWLQMPWVPKGFQRHHAIGVVNVARLTGEISLLPTALWQCSMLGSDVSQGFTYSDGTVETLSLEDLGFCLHGQAKMAQQMTLNFIACFNPPLSEGCKRGKGPNPCACKSFDAFPLMKQFFTELPVHYPNPIITPWSWAQYFKGFCEECLRTIKARGERVRRESWQKLPSFFRLEVPEWGVSSSGASRSLAK